MASLRKTIPVPADLDTAWAAVKDFGALHTRLVPRFVTACTAPEEGVREIVFANGGVCGSGWWVWMTRCGGWRTRL